MFPTAGWPHGCTDRYDPHVTRVLIAAASALVVLGLVGLAWSIPLLAGGIEELPRHWWSTLPAALVVVGVALVTALSRGSRRPSL
jgi:cytochrome bd-type quinol oxidase subunit 2